MFPGLWADHHLGPRGGNPKLKEVVIAEATMQRRLVVTYRSNSYMSLAAAQLAALLGRARLAD